VFAAQKVTDQVKICRGFFLIVLRGPMAIMRFVLETRREHAIAV